MSTQNRNTLFDFHVVCNVFKAVVHRADSEWEKIHFFPAREIRAPEELDNIFGIFRYLLILFCEILMKFLKSEIFSCEKKSSELEIEMSLVLYTMSPGGASCHRVTHTMSPGDTVYATRWHCMRHPVAL